MGLKKTENQVQVLLKDTILALCRNTLNYNAEICVEGLLCITLDCEEVLLVNINQIIKNREVLKCAKNLHKNRKRPAEISSDDDDDIFACGSPKSRRQTSSINEQPQAVVTLLNEGCDIKHNADRISKNSQDTILNLSEEVRNSIRTTSPQKSSEIVIHEDNDFNTIVKEEPPDVIVIKEEMNHEEVLPPSCGISRDDVNSSLNSDLGHCSSTWPSDSDYQILQSQGDIVPILGHGIDSSELRGGFVGSASNLPSSGGTMHVCLLCGKSFAWQWLLKRHQVVHSGDKDYSCEHCQRSFSYQSSVKRHQERCAARLEYLHLNNTPGVLQESAFTPGGSTFQNHMTNEIKQTTNNT